MIRASVKQRSRVKHVEAKYESAVRETVALAVQMVRNIAVESIQQHGSAGRTYQKYNPRRTHTASAAGNPPNTDTGYLVSNIFMEIDPDGFGGSVDSRANYSADLEFGTSKMQARPFMVPAAEEARPKVKRLLIAKMRAASRGTK